MGCQRDLHVREKQGDFKFYYRREKNKRRKPRRVYAEGEDTGLLRILPFNFIVTSGEGGPPSVKIHDMSVGPGSAPGHYNHRGCDR